jgi:large subunit ribosomal protein L14
MILKGTKLNYSDNSGVKTMVCVRLVGGSIKKAVNTGELVRIVVKTVRNKKKIVKKKMYLALMVGTKKKQTRPDGSCIQFHNNRAVLLNDQKKFMGTRVYGPVAKEVKGGKTNMKFRKVIACSDGTI